MSSHLAQNLQLLKEISDDIQVIKKSQSVALERIKDIREDIIKLNMIEEKIEKGEKNAIKQNGWFFWSS